MIVVGSLVILALFLLVGWAVSTEMFQQRAWRRRVEQGDVDIVAALLEEGMGTWRRSRPPRDLPASLWAGVQGAEVIAVGPDSAAISASAEGEFRTEDGRRVRTISALDQAMALAAKLIDMVLYDVPNLRLQAVRVDIYSTFTGDDGQAEQRPILTTTAERAVADGLVWEAMTPGEILGRFETVYERGSGGLGLPISVLPPEGKLPAAGPSPAGDASP